MNGVKLIRPSLLVAKSLKPAPNAVSLIKAEILKFQFPKWNQKLTKVVTKLKKMPTMNSQGIYFFESSIESFNLFDLSSLKYSRDGQGYVRSREVARGHFKVVEDFKF